MRVYIDQDEKLTFNKTDTPIDINTDITYFKMLETNNKEIKTVNGEFSYIDSLDNITNEKYSFLKKNKIENEEISNFDSSYEELDEDIYYSEEIENEPNLTSVKIFKEVEINKDTIESFNVEDILELDHTKKLNDSSYEYMICDFLNETVISDSSFKILDRFKVILGKNDSLIISFSIPLSNKFKFNNLDENLSVFINDNKMEFKNDSFELETKLKNNFIKIEICNNTNKNIRIIDPYLFIK